MNRFLHKRGLGFYVTLILGIWLTVNPLNKHQFNEEGFGGKKGLMQDSQNNLLE